MCCPEVCLLRRGGMALEARRIWKASAQKLTYSLWLMLIWVKKFFFNVCILGQSSQSGVCTGWDLPGWRFSERVDRFMGVKGPDIRNSGLGHWGENWLKKQTKTTTAKQTNKNKPLVWYWKRQKWNRDEQEGNSSVWGEDKAYFVYNSLILVCKIPSHRTKSQALFCAIKIVVYNVKILP